MKSLHKNAVYYLILLLVAVGVLGFLATAKNRQGTSKAMLFLTDPIYSVTGKVEKVEGDTITLTVTHQAPVPAGTKFTGQIPEPPKAETMTFTVRMDGQTTYKSPQGDSPVPYLFGGTDQRAGKPDKKSVSAGQIITVESKTDLRNLDGQTFTASVITLPPFANMLTGTVLSVTKNSITVSSVNGQKTIAVTAATEISSSVNEGPDKPATPKKFNFDEIKTGGQLTVYTDKDVSGDEPLTALRIDPIMLYPGKEPVVGTQKQIVPAQEAVKPTAPQSTVPSKQAVIPTLDMPTINPQQYVAQ